MKPYDPSVDYLGPNRSAIKKYIPTFPPGCEELKPLWNIHAYNHDCDYFGDDYSGWFGWLKKWMDRRRVAEARWLADHRFYEGLMLSIESLQDKLTGNQIIIAQSYARIVFEAVNSFGWAFYRVGEK